MGGFNFQVLNETFLEYFVGVSIVQTVHLHVHSTRKKNYIFSIDVVTFL